MASSALLAACSAEATVQSLGWVYRRGCCCQVSLQKLVKVELFFSMEILAQKRRRLGRWGSVYRAGWLLSVDSRPAEGSC